VRLRERTHLAGGLALVLLLVACADATSSSETSGSDRLRPDGTYTFVEFPWEDMLADPDSVRLCAGSNTPNQLDETTFIDCRLEGANFTRAVAPTDVTEITVMAYNLERGLRLEQQLAWLQRHPDAPDPDVLLISEADRGCSRTDDQNVMAESLLLSSSSYREAIPKQTASWKLASMATEFSAAIRLATCVRFVMLKIKVGLTIRASRAWAGALRLSPMSTLEVDFCMSIRCTSSRIRSGSS